SWSRWEGDSNLDGNRRQHALAWTNSSGDLLVKCLVVEYQDFPVVEWTVFFKNIGTANTPILQDLQGLDVKFHRSGNDEFVLNGNRGDYCAADSYQPFRITLPPSFT